MIFCKWSFFVCRDGELYSIDWFPYPFYLLELIYLSAASRDLEEGEDFTLLSYSMTPSYQEGLFSYSWAVTAVLGTLDLLSIWLPSYLSLLFGIGGPILGVKKPWLC